MDYMDLSSIKFYKSYEEFVELKKKERIILATTKAKKIYTNFIFKKNDTLLFGRESSGVPESLHKSIKFKIKIPMVENKRSLNLATSVAIIISESLRQTL
jgi:tRNA (cytidine/uridine-2'-O-)-methyltransferase